MNITVPDPLLNAATELAEARGITLQQLLLEALADSVESHLREGWLQLRIPLRRDEVRSRVHRRGAIELH